MAVPTFTSTGNDSPGALPDPRVGGQPQASEAERNAQIVETLNAYRLEGVANRSGGANPRDAKWAENANLYWNRFDFSGKAKWQSKEVMPEVPSFVDRFAAALKEALVAVPEGFFDVVDPADDERELAGAVKRMTDVWLSRAGRNQQGQLISFPAVFEEQVKLGALMAMSATVTWKEDVPGGRVGIETVDPQTVWLDHTYRNLYRVRRITLDRHELLGMARQRDRAGKPIWNLEAIEQLTAWVGEVDAQARERLTGTSNQVISPRVEIVLDEYVATVLDRQGNVIEKDGLFVVANERFLVRGPEKNPFAHGKDWLVFAPLITTPLSVYGRSYMEDFGSLAKTFNELTNLLLDAARASATKSYAIVPSMLSDPRQGVEGVWPGKTFLLEDGVDASKFAQALELGGVNRDAVAVWENMKNELREAAGINEIGLGQFAPNSRTSATEVMQTQQSSSALIRSVAQTIETRWLDPVLDLTWKTGVQHVRKDDRMLRTAAGSELFDALMARRPELLSRPFTFQARGISTLIQKQQMLQRLMSVMQIIASNEVLLTAFLQQIDVNRFIGLVLNLSNVDITRMQLTDRQKLIQSLVQPLQQMQQGAMGQPPVQGPAGDQMRDVASSMGVGRGG